MKANPYSSILLVALTFAITLTAAAKGPQKKVLFELEPNEIIDEMEYSSSFHLGRYGFSCILRDTTTNFCTFVWNGERKVRSRLVAVEKCDLFDYDKCVIVFNDANGVYLQTAGETQAFESCYQPSSFDYAKTSNPSIYRVQFTQMGIEYIRDYDGVVYKKDDGRTEFISSNGKHKAELKNTGKIVIDGTEIPLPGLIDTDKESAQDIDVYVLNNGGCYLSGVFHEQEKRSYKSYYILKRKFTELGAEDNLILNLDTGKLEVDPFPREPDDYVPDFTPQSPSNGVYTRSHLLWVWEESSWLGGEPDYQYNFSLQDKSLKHLFFSSWEYDYVLIDNEKYGTSCPIDAYYDEKRNSFVWVSLEEQKLIQYTFKL